MFAINHAATALVVKKRYPAVPLVWLLVSVQFVEILWVMLNFIGVERTSTDATVNTVSEIHLEYMPFSHSLASSLLFACVTWFIVARVDKHRTAAIAVAMRCSLPHPLGRVYAYSGYLSIPFSARRRRWVLGFMQYPWQPSLSKRYTAFFAGGYFEAVRRFSQLSLFSISQTFPSFPSRLKDQKC